MAMSAGWAKRQSFSPLVQLPRWNSLQTSSRSVLISFCAAAAVCTGTAWFPVTSMGALGSISAGTKFGETGPRYGLKAVLGLAARPVVTENIGSLNHHPRCPASAIMGCRGAPGIMALASCICWASIAMFFCCIRLFLPFISSWVFKWGGGWRYLQFSLEQRPFSESKQAMTRPFSTWQLLEGWANLHSVSGREQVPLWNSRHTSSVSHFVSRIWATLTAMFVNEQTVEIYPRSKIYQADCGAMRVGQRKLCGGLAGE